MPKNKEYSYVGIQLVLFAAYLFPVKIISISVPQWLSYLGVVLVILGVILGTIALLQINTKLSPFPTPVSGSILRTTRAFAIARHPIYTAIVFATLGYGLFQDSLFKLLIAIALLVLFYFKSKYEEQLLEAKFPEYQKYKHRTGRFFLKFRK